MKSVSHSAFSEIEEFFMNYDVKARAYEALEQYLYRMTGKGHSIELKVNAEGFDVEDPQWDDAYQINVQHGAGEIVASNERSLLLGVYHLLRDCGCAFVRPGKDSERVPRCNTEQINSQRFVKAAHRFRGLCIEGSCNVRDTVDLLEWMPKVGMNCYFMQFREGYNFFERWYECTSNEQMMPWEFNLDVCRSIIPQIEYAAHKNGLMYHGGGHGFTCECFGVPGLGWIEMDNWPEEFTDALAMRNGKRDLAWHMPLISALCYSNVDVQKRVVDSAVDYIAQHPELDYVHFWLDDGNNNKCECENCRNERVAEFYIQMLNRLDRQLSDRGLNTKIVFLAYHELLWPPLKEKLEHPERFTFMFAPIQRSFLHPFCDVKQAAEMPRYTLNNQPFPRNNEDVAAHLKAWNDYRTSLGMSMEDSFDFDYYCTDYNDPGQFVQARLIYEDVTHMKQNHLGGLINCQEQRAFDHAALPMYVMARALVEPQRPFDELVDEFFQGAFGDESQEYRRIWENWTKVSEVIRDPSSSDFDPLVKALSAPLPQVSCKDLATSHSRKLMRFTAQVFLRIAAYLKAERAGDRGAAAKARVELDRYTCAKECEFAPEFDRKYFEGAVDKLLGIKHIV